MDWRVGSKIPQALGGACWDDWRMSVVVENAPSRSAVLPPVFASGLGLACLVLGLGGLGVLALIYSDFAFQWQPVPPEIPARGALALANGVFLVGACAALLWGRTRIWAGLALGVYLFLWTFVLHTPRLIAGVEAAWNGMAEIGTLTAAAFLIAAREAGREQMVRVARFAFALCLPVFGVAHFLYAEFTASMVPAWLPAPLFWAYFTGVGHVAGGLSILTGILPRLGATLFALMVSCFVVLLHIPRVAAAPDNRFEWTMLCVALSITGAAWTIAGSLRERGNRE